MTDLEFVAGRLGMKTSIGDVFNRLTVIGHLRRKDTKHVRCICSCGRETVARERQVISGQTKSCGCLAAELSSSRAKKHGYSGTHIYWLWRTILKRCDNHKSILYASYGGRGITVCDRWRSFTNFMQDMGERPPGTSIDRINGNGNYEPGNCRWATRAEQSRNTSRNVFITINGETLCLTDWAKRSGIPKGSLRDRVRRGVVGEALIAAPKQRLERSA